MQYQYGEMFQRLGITSKGRQGGGWCGIDPNGVLVLMSHQAFYRRENGAWVYDGPGHERLPTISTTAARSIRMLAEYFEPEKPILLPIGVFDSDGGFRPDGTHDPSKFHHATGDVWRAKMREFDPATGHILCDCVEKFTA